MRSGYPFAVERAAKLSGGRLETTATPGPHTSLLLELNCQLLECVLVDRQPLELGEH